MTARRVLGAGLAGLAIALGSLVALPHTARAATTWVVDQTLDTGPLAHCPSVNPALPTCTLREAVKDAVAADTIKLGAGTFHLSIPPLSGDSNASGDLNITGGATIEGAGAAATTVMGDSTLKDRLISASGGPLRISALTLSGGAAGSSLNDGGCGSGCPGGAIDSTVPVEATDVVISNNTATGNGGGVNLVVNHGGSAFLRVRFVGNHALAVLEADNGGAGVYDELANSTSCPASAAQPRLVGSFAATDTYTDVSFSGNSALMNGGGGYFESACLDGGGSILNRVEFDGNSAGHTGGAAYSADSGGLSISNATITKNAAGTGGSAVAGAAFNAGFELNNATINNNHGPSALLTGTRLRSDTVGIANTILYGNGPAGGAPRECDFTSNPTMHYTGWVLTDTTAAECRLSAAAADHNQPNGLSPQLGPLAGNGGFVKTEALLSGSSAIDSGNPATPNSDGNLLFAHYLSSVPPPCMPMDARGSARPSGPACDKGAYEAAASTQAPPSPTPAPVPVPSTGAGAGQPISPGAFLLGATVLLGGAAAGLRRRRPRG